MDVWTVVTSAAVGALASALVNVVGQWRERAARRRELLFRTALELAHKRQDLLVEEARRTNERLLMPDAVFNVAEYFRHLEHLFDKGELPRELREKQEVSRLWHATMDQLRKDRGEPPVA